MSTQRTRVRTGGQPPTGTTPPNEPPQSTEPDLGIPENIDVRGNEKQDPPVSTAEPRVVFGRQMRPVSPEDLVRAHQAYAGDKVDMLGSPISRRTEQQEEKPIIENPQPAKPTADEIAVAQREAQRIMPEVFKIPPTTAQVAAPPTQPIAPQEQQGVALPPAMGMAEAEEAAKAFEFLTDAEAKALESGNYEAAAQAHALSLKLKERFVIKSTAPKKERHPALQKLLANLGLERIKNTEIDWGGSKWMFAPTTAKLDRWISTNQLPDGLNIGALIIAASTIAIDGVPIYKVVGIPIERSYEIKPIDSQGTTTTLTIRQYKKMCTCGDIYAADGEKCSTCGALLDPFDIPADLRLDCAKAFYTILEDKFGAYEDLINLVELKDSAMKDRRFHKDDLYPLLKPSPNPEKTQE